MFINRKALPTHRSLSKASTEAKASKVIRKQNIRIHDYESRLISTNAKLHTHGDQHTIVCGTSAKES